MYRKMGFLFVALILILTGRPVYAGGNTPADANAEIILQLNSREATVRGEATTLEAPPTLVKDTTLVPLRFISEALGAQLDWDAATQTITLTYQSKTIQLTIGQAEARVNGEAAELDQPPVILNGSTMVPVRFIAESFERDIAFKPAAGIITITRPDSADGTSSKKLKPAAPSKPRLDKITVDNLTEAWEIGYVAGLDTRRTTTNAILSLAADHSGHIYALHRSETGTYRVYQYDSTTGGPLALAVPFDDRLNVGFSSNPTYAYDELKPSQIYYSENTNSLYMKCEYYPKISNPYLPGTAKTAASIIYKIVPNINVVTYKAMSGTSSQDNEFFYTPDGDRFYFSSHADDVIYQLEAVEKDGSVPKIPLKPSEHPAAAMEMNNTVLVFDKKNKVISQLDKDGLFGTAKVDVTDDILYATSWNGAFYFSTAEGIYKLDANGAVTPYALLKDLSYNKGLYKPVTDVKTNASTSNAAGQSAAASQDEPGTISLTSSTVFILNQDGNVFLYDSTYHILRMIRIYAE